MQREMLRVSLPLHQLWAEIERYTSGNGYPVKLCLEVLGMGSSRDRSLWPMPPIFFGVRL